MGKIGITTTIPQEIVWASGNIPVDLNNILVSSPRRGEFLNRAYIDGFPRTSCPWISGIYGAIREGVSLDALIVVVQGDCSNAHALAETLEDIGLEIIPFGYPYDSDPSVLRAEMFHLANKLGAEWDEVLDTYENLASARELTWLLDDMTWKDDLVTGFENHLWLVSTSDFNSDVHDYKMKISEVIARAEQREPMKQRIRLGYIGVPPIFPGLYDDIERMGARVVFNETQRQFSIPFPNDDLVTAYSRYTYPLSVFRRIEDIQREIERRGIHGILHYTQNFCYRQIEDLIFRRHLKIPILTVEGESNFDLDERTRIRLEAFIQMLENNIDKKEF